MLPRLILDPSILRYFKILVPESIISQVVEDNIGILTELPELHVISRWKLGSRGLSVMIAFHHPMEIALILSASSRALGELPIS